MRSHHQRQERYHHIGQLQRYYQRNLDNASPTLRHELLRHEHGAVSRSQSIRLASFRGLLRRAAGTQVDNRIQLRYVRTYLEADLAASILYVD